MATLSVTNTFVDATAAEAGEVNENFDDIVTFVNADVIHRDASIAFTAVPTGPSTDPSSANQLSRKSYVDAGDATNAAAIAAEAVTRALHVNPRRGVQLNSNTNTIGAGATANIVFASEAGDADFWTSGANLVFPVAGIYVAEAIVTAVGSSEGKFNLVVPAVRAWTTGETIWVGTPSITLTVVVPASIGTILNISVENNTVDAGLNPVSGFFSAQLSAYRVSA